MQETSALYKELLSGPHTIDTRLTIGESGRLMTEHGNVITFGGTSILVADGGADSGFDESTLISIHTSSMVFKNAPSVGNTIASEIEISMLKPMADIPRQARLVPYVRLSDGNRHSEWLQKGVYFIDTREYEADHSGIETLVIHGYDAMLKAEQDYPASTMSWPAIDIDVVMEIARAMGVSVDKRTFKAMNHSYRINYPAGYSQREVLGNIAAMYGGNFLMSDLGELRLALLAEIPPETRYLVDNAGYSITFGGDRILV